jgi:hypothetical protein
MRHLERLFLDACTRMTTGSLTRALGHELQASTTWIAGLYHEACGQRAPKHKLMNIIVVNQADLKVHRATDKIFAFAAFAAPGRSHVSVFLPKA